MAFNRSRKSTKSHRGWLDTPPETGGEFTPVADDALEPPARGSRSRFRRISGAAARDPAEARNAAIALLARRDFASGELKQRLERKGFESAAAAEAVADLAEQRLLDDARFAESYVSYHASRHEGPVRIAAELKQMGVASELIEAAVAGGPDWRSMARELRERKFGTQPPQEWESKARQARFLQYRGFSADHIRAALGADFDPD